MGRCPALIACYLKLPDADKYTGHAFRRTSATVMANDKMTVEELKRQVGWKSSTVAAGYIEESIQTKTDVSKLIAKVVNQGGPSQENNTDNEAKVVSSGSANSIDVCVCNEIQL